MSDLEQPVTSLVSQVSGALALGLIRFSAGDDRSIFGHEIAEAVPIEICAVAAFNAGCMLTARDVGATAAIFILRDYLDQLEIELGATTVARTAQ